MSSVASDLSPYYLAKARDNVRYWKQQRAGEQLLGGWRDTGKDTALGRLLESGHKVWNTVFGAIDLGLSCIFGRFVRGSAVLGTAESSRAAAGWRIGEAYISRVWDRISYGSLVMV